MEIASPLPGTEPPRDCPRCPRLVALRAECRTDHPDWWNAPVYAFGDPDAWLAFAGLAPGKQGANRTGRPFTGDYAGDLRSEEHTSELQSLMRISYAVFCLKKNTYNL